MYFKILVNFIFSVLCGSLYLLFLVDIVENLESKFLGFEVLGVVIGLDIMDFGYL